MDLTFLGTAAAGGYPNAFCRCNHCEQARILGGRSLRKRASALINDDLLIDFGPDIMTASVLHNRPLTHVRYCLQTHPHADHLDTSLLLSRNPDWGVVGVPRLQMYASTGTLGQLAQLLGIDVNSDGDLDPRAGDWLHMDLHRIQAFQTFDVGPYRVTALAANHDQAVEPLLYVIEGEGRTIFYGTDTAALPEETWKACHQRHLRFDLVVLDHTYGIDTLEAEHLNPRRFREQIARMRAEELLSKEARIFATHFSPETVPPHPQMVEIAARHGYEIAYDGLTV